VSASRTHADKQAVPADGPYCLDTTATTGGRGTRNPSLAAALAEDPVLGRRNYRKRFAIRMARQLNRAGEGQLAARVGGCGDTLAFDQSGRLVGRERCNVRLCPNCQAVRSARWAIRLRAGLVLACAELPGVSFAHLTLTVRNCQMRELRQRTQQLHAALHRFTKRRAFSATGWIRNTEFTVNGTTGDAHPHVHMLLVVPVTYFRRRLHTTRTAAGRSRIVPGYVTHGEYVELWRKSARLDYAPSVCIQGVRIDTPRGKRALYELTKYGVKPASLLDLAPAVLKELGHQVAGIRGIAVGGVLRPFLREPNDDADSLADAVITSSASWEHASQRYRMADAATRALPPSGDAPTG
jgi:plasmid rolling circle replication initiator protein Rep